MSYSILKDSNKIDISHIKRIRKNQDLLEILLGTQTMVDKIDKQSLFDIVGEQEFKNAKVCVN